MTAETTCTARPDAGAGAGERKTRDLAGNPHHLLTADLARGPWPSWSSGFAAVRPEAGARPRQHWPWFLAPPGAAPSPAEHVIDS